MEIKPPVKPPLLSRLSALTICIIFVWTNILFAQRANPSFWEERRNVVAQFIERRSTAQGDSTATTPDGSATLTTGKSGNYNLLAQLPTLQTSITDRGKNWNSSVSPLPVRAVRQAHHMEGQGEGIGRRELNETGSSSTILSSIAPYAEIKDVYSPSLAPNPKSLAPVVIIQDVHQHYEAQKNIANVINVVAQFTSIPSFSKGGLGRIMNNPPQSPFRKGGSSGSITTPDKSGNYTNSVFISTSTCLNSIVIGVEGAAGPFDFSPYRAYSDKQLTKDIANFFMQQGMIGGPEFFGITAPEDSQVRMVGAEDEKLYLANIQAFKDSLPLERQVKVKVNKRQVEIKIKKEKAFNTTLLELDKKREAYHEGKLNLGVYLTLLKNTATTPDKSGNYKQHNAITQKRYNAMNVSCLVEAYQIEKSLNISKLESERSQILSILTEKLPKHALDGLLNYALAYRTGNITYAQFYAYFRKAAQSASINFSNFPEMDKYVRYVQLTDSIDKNKLFSEIEQLENYLENKLTKTKEEKLLLQDSKYLELVKKLVDFSLTPEEWHSYVSLRVKRSNLTIRNKQNEIAASPLATRNDVSLRLAPFESFYETALKRNEVLVSNLLSTIPSFSKGGLGRIMNNPPQSYNPPFPSFRKGGDSGKAFRKGGDNGIAILIAGGFHTNGITQILKQKNIPYIVLAPNVTKVEEGQKSLELIARAKTPLEKLFAGEKIFLSSPRLLGIVNPIKGQVSKAAAVEAQLDTLYTTMSENSDKAAKEVNEASTSKSHEVLNPRKQDYGLFKIIRSQLKLKSSNKIVQQLAIISDSSKESIVKQLSRYKNTVKNLIPTLSGKIGNYFVSLWIKQKPVSRVNIGTVLGLVALAVYLFSPFLASLSGINHPGTADFDFHKWFIPIFLMPCDMMYYMDELRKQKEREAIETEQQAEEIVQEIEKSLTEMGDLLDDLAESITEESEENLDTEIAGEEKHDIREITIRSLVRYLQSDKKDKSFAEAINLLAKNLHSGVLQQDSLEKVRQVLEKDKTKKALSEIYEKASKDIKPVEGDNGSPSANVHSNALTALRQHLANLAKHLGGHTHFILLGFFLGYLLAKFILGLDWTSNDLWLGFLTTTPFEGFIPEQKTDYLNRYTNDLDELAGQGKIDDTYYLSEYASRLNDQMFNDINNVIIVGDPSVSQGLINGVVVRKASLENLKDARFFEINTARFVESLAIPGQLESEMAKLIQTIKSAYPKERVILTLNFQDFHSMYKMKTGMMASLYFQLKEAIEDKNISLVILAHPHLYHNELSKDKRLEAKFEIIDLSFPPEYDLLRIARSYARRINSLYQDMLPPGIKINISSDVLEKALALSQKYYPQGLSINKFQEVIDKIITNTFTRPKRLTAQIADIRERLIKAAQQLARSIKEGKNQQELEFSELTLDRLLIEHKTLENRMAEHQEFILHAQKESVWQITLEEAAQQISEDSGVPLYEIMATEDELLKQYRPKLRSMLIGQDEVIEESYNAFSRRRVLGEKKNQPIGVNLLVGPTGVGKTEFARSLARYMFGSEDALIRLDMTEYMNPQDDQKLIGPPPGYVGYEEGGQLTNHVLRRPYSVVLLDEIEKANPKILDLLLQVFNDGELRDGKGRIANFRNTIIIMTSNLGFSEISEADKIEARVSEEMIKLIEQQIKSLEDEDKASDIELKEELSRLNNILSRLNNDLSLESNVDPVLEMELKGINELLSEDRIFAEDKEARAKFLKKHLIETKKRLKQYEELSIANAYRIIAKFKDTTTPDSQKQLDSILNTRKEFLKLEIQMLENLSGPEYQKLFKKYSRLRGILASEYIELKRTGLLEYLRSEVREKIVVSVKSAFKPELVGRIGLGNIISFNPLSRQDLEKILDIKLSSVNNLLKEAGFGKLILTPNLREEVISAGYDVTNGARPLERAFKRIVLAPLSKDILSGNLEKGMDIETEYEKDKVAFVSKQKQEDKTVMSNQEIIERIKNLAESDYKEEDLISSLELGAQGFSPIPVTATDMQQLRKRFEIDIPDPDEMPELNIDISQIDTRLAEIKISVDELQGNLKTLDTQLRQTRNDQQKQAISTQMAKQTIELEILNRQQQILQARKETKEDQAQKLSQEFTQQMEEGQKQARKSLNATFENLTIEAYEGVINDIHPPFAVIDKLAGIIKQKKRNYPLILSDSLLLQRSAVDTFVKRITQNELPGFENTRVLRLKLETLKDYFSLVGYFELKMREIIGFIEEDDKNKNLNTIVVVDFDEVKNELERVRFNPFMLGYFLRMFKELKTISFIMTTSQQAIVEDDSFDLYFTMLEMPQQESKAVLEDLALFLRDNIEKKTAPVMKIKIAFEAMQMAVKLWSQYFISQTPIEVLNRWFSGLIQQKNQKQSKLALELKDNWERLLEELQDIAGEGNISEETLTNNKEILRLIRQINMAKLTMQKAPSVEINRADLLDFASETEERRGTVKIDVNLFKTDEKENLLKLEEILDKRIVAQQEAIGVISSAVRIAAAGLKPPKAPLGTFIFAGPTGVGKTQLAKTLSQTLGMNILRIDMSEYKDRTDLSRLIGAPPGFIGYDEGEGFLFEHMKRNPKTVLIFDEIDKAAPAVMNILLQVLEDGRLTSNRGNTVKFNEAIIILTANLGMKRTVIKDGKTYEVSLYPQMEEAMRSNNPDMINAFKKAMTESIIESSKRFFRPEFLNRIDATLIFNPLPLDSLKQIVEIILSETMQAFQDRQGIELVIGETTQERNSIYTHLAELGYNPEFGARPMEEAVKRYFENPLTGYITQNISSLRKNGKIIAKFENGSITFEHIPQTGEKSKQLPQEDLDVIEMISLRFNQKPAEPLTIEELEEIFGFRKEVNLGSGEQLEFTEKAQTITVSQLNFFKKDETVNTAAKEISSILPEKTISPSTKEPINTERLKSLTVEWLKETIRIAKMANLESHIWEKEKRIIKDYYNLRKSNLNEEVASYFGQDGIEGKDVEIIWEYENDYLKIAVSYNSGLTRYLQRNIFTTQYANKEDIDKNAPRNLQGLLKAKMELDKIGAAFNFYQQEGKTTIWLTVPVEEPARTAEEETDILSVLIKQFGKIKTGHPAIDLILLGISLNQIGHSLFPYQMETNLTRLTKTIKSLDSINLEHFKELSTTLAQLKDLELIKSSAKEKINEILRLINETGSGESQDPMQGIEMAQPTGQPSVAISANFMQELAQDVVKFLEDWVEYNLAWVGSTSSFKIDDIKFNFIDDDYSYDFDGAPDSVSPSMRINVPPNFADPIGLIEKFAAHIESWNVSENRKNLLKNKAEEIRQRIAQMQNELMQETIEWLKQQTWFTDSGAGSVRLNVQQVQLLSNNTYEMHILLGQRGVLYRGENPFTRVLTVFTPIELLLKFREELRRTYGIGDFTTGSIQTFNNKIEKLQQQMLQMLQPNYKSTKPSQKGLKTEQSDESQTESLLANLFRFNGRLSFLNVLNWPMRLVFAPGIIWHERAHIKYAREHGLLSAREPLGVVILNAMKNLAVAVFRLNRDSSPSAQNDINLKNAETSGNKTSKTNRVRWYHYLTETPADIRGPPVLLAQSANFRAAWKWAIPALLVLILNLHLNLTPFIILIPTWIALSNFITGLIEDIVKIPLFARIYPDPDLTRAGWPNPVIKYLSNVIATSLIGLSMVAEQNVDEEDETPLLFGFMPSKRLDSIKEKLNSMAPEIAKAMPELNHAIYADLISYAAIKWDSITEQPIVLIEVLLENEPEQEFIDAWLTLQAILLAHEGLQYQLRLQETGSADLTEELALFFEVDRMLWLKLKDKPELREAIKALAKQLDNNEPHQPNRLLPSLERLDNYSDESKEPDKENTWQELADELAPYPWFAGQSFKQDKFISLRERLAQLIRKEPQQVNVVAQFIERSSTTPDKSGDYTTTTPDESGNYNLQSAMDELMQETIEFLEIDRWKMKSGKRLSVEITEVREEFYVEFRYYELFPGARRVKNWLGYAGGFGIKHVDATNPVELLTKFLEIIRKAEIDLDSKSKQLIKQKIAELRQRMEEIQIMQTDESETKGPQSAVSWVNIGIALFLVTFTAYMFAPYVTNFFSMGGSLSGWIGVSHLSIVAISSLIGLVQGFLKHEGGHALELWLKGQKAHWARVPGFWGGIGIASKEGDSSATPQNDTKFASPISGIRASFLGMLVPLAILPLGFLTAPALSASIVVASLTADLIFGLSILDWKNLAVTHKSAKIKKLLMGTLLFGPVGTGDLFSAILAGSIPIALAPSIHTKKAEKMSSRVILSDSEESRLSRPSTTGDSSAQPQNDIGLDFPARTNLIPLQTNLTRAFDPNFYRQLLAPNERQRRKNLLAAKQWAEFIQALELEEETPNKLFGYGTSQKNLSRIIHYLSAKELIATMKDADVLFAKGTKSLVITPLDVSDMDDTTQSRNAIRFLVNKMLKAKENGVEIFVPLVTNQDSLDKNSIQEIVLNTLTTTGMNVKEANDMLDKAHFGEFMITRHDLAQKQKTDPAILIDSEAAYFLIQERIKTNMPALKELVPVYVLTTNPFRWTKSWRKEIAMHILTIISPTDVIEIERQTESIFERVRMALKQA